MAKKKYSTWYQQESRGGRKFVDVSIPENYEKLTPIEKHYLEYQERVYKYSVEDTAEAYASHYDSSMRRNAAARQYQMFTGELYTKSLDTYFENYMTALGFVAHSEMKNLFKRVWKTMSYTDRESFTRDVLPVIPVFYKVSHKADSANTNQVGTTQIEGAMEELGKELLKEANSRGINIIYYLHNDALTQQVFGMSWKELRDYAHANKGISVKEYVESVLSNSNED